MWRVRWFDPGGRRVCRSFKSYDEAVAFDDVVKQAASVRQPVGDLHPDVLVDATRLNISARGYYVYMLCDAVGDPFYIGRSKGIFARLGDHMERRDRRTMTESVALIGCNSEAEMKALELVLIKLYRPKLNIKGIVEKPAAVSRREKFVRDQARRRRRRVLNGLSVVRDPSDTLRSPDSTPSDLGKHGSS
jgi:hypothetical protein